VCSYILRHTLSVATVAFRRLLGCDVGTALIVSCFALGCGAQPGIFGSWQVFAGLTSVSMLQGGEQGVPSPGVLPRKGVRSGLRAFLLVKHNEHGLLILEVLHPTSFLCLPSPFCPPPPRSIRTLCMPHRAGAITYGQVFRAFKCPRSSGTCSRVRVLVHSGAHTALARPPPSHWHAHRHRDARLKRRPYSAHMRRRARSAREDGTTSCREDTWIHMSWNITVKQRLRPPTPNS
jgi:hypothetical protein